MTSRQRSKRCTEDAGTAGQGHSPRIGIDCDEMTVRPLAVLEDLNLRARRPRAFTRARAHRLPSMRLAGQRPGSS